LAFSGASGCRYLLRFAEEKGKLSPTLGDRAQQYSPTPTIAIRWPETSAIIGRQVWNIKGNFHNGTAAVSVLFGVLYCLGEIGYEE
jgi:hypothetical protein